MEQKHHYTGLTDAQVLESRQMHGVNVLTPPEKETMWDVLKETCTHWIAISMFALIVISAIANIEESKLFTVYNPCSFE